MPVTRMDQIETPALLVDMDVLEANIRKMAAYFRGKRAKLRPHYKTHKSPAIAHMQMAEGAKGITCAKLGEAQTLAEAGIRDILIANQIADSQKIDRLAGLAKNVKMTVCVDNAQNIKELSLAAAAHGSTIYALVEVEVGMQRCGVNSKEEALSLARQVSASKGLVFEGLQAYAGQLSHIPEHEARVKGTGEAEMQVLKVRNYLESNGFNVNEVSGAGTGTYNIPGDKEIWTEIQAGSYVFMDTDYIKLDLGFETALTVLASVIHKRHGYAITDAGLKVCCQENGPPALRGLPGLQVLALSEEHGKIQDAKNELKYLQKVEYIPSHCCATVNLHDYYHCVRGGLLEAVWPVSGRGKSR